MWEEGERANEDPEQFGSDLNIGVELFVPLSASLNSLFSEKSVKV